MLSTGLASTLPASALTLPPVLLHASSILAVLNLRDSPTLNSYSTGAEEQVRRREPRPDHDRMVLCRRRTAWVPKGGSPEYR